MRGMGGPGTLVVCVSLSFVLSGMALSWEIRDPSVSTTPETLLGITWPDSHLVSFDPHAGQVLATHRALPPGGGYSGLAYDRNHHRLYVMAQGTGIVDVIDTDSLRIVDKLYLHIDPGVPGGSDTVTLAYDPDADILYTLIGHWIDYPAGPISSELAVIDTESGALTILGRIDGPWITSIAYSETDRQLYGIGVYGAGSWDSDEPTHFLRINPATAQMTPVFETPYHTVLGLAVQEPFTFFSWVNSTEHSYGLTDLQMQTVSPLGGSDSVGAIYAMVRGDFSFPREPTPIPPEPESFFVDGVVSSVHDPKRLLSGRVRKGDYFWAAFTYDAEAPYQWPDPNRGKPYGLTLSMYKHRFDATGLLASIENNRYDPSDRALKDRFTLVARSNRSVEISWTLVDPTGLAVQRGDRLPSSFDLSAWRTNVFTVSQYDGQRVLYTVSGSVRRVLPVGPVLTFPTPRSR